MESDAVVLRGFSNTFGFDKKAEVMDLQFIEGEELEHQWKVARRQRLKQQEDKIWNEFVKEEDVVKNFSNEDPYQFLNQLPEAHVKDLFESELSRIKKELEGQKRGAGDSPRNDKSSVSGDVEPEEMFHIFDDEKEDACEENLNDTLESPCTVREKDENNLSGREPMSGGARALIAPASPPPERSENVATVIESSIYCAKVKELRLKIINEIRNMILSLESQNIASIDSLQLRQLCRRAAEYSARYQRIHLYQLQRQVNDIKRHNTQALPFAKHTQFQSQMVRIVALHQSTLQSLQVFHKSFEQTSCLRECSTQLRMICSTLRDSTSTCREVPVPNDFSAAKELYNDAMLSACDRLENALKHYVTRVEEYTAAADQMYTNRSSQQSTKKSKSKKKSAINTWSQKATKNSLTEANSRLSMYSLETLRLNKNQKQPLKSEKARSDSTRRKGKIDKATPKSHRKSPRARRPLMRDPHSGDRRRPHNRDARPDNDPDVQTMVEAIGIPGSSHMSGDTSPNSMRRSPRACLLFPRSPRPPPVPPIVPPIALCRQRAVSPKSRVSPQSTKKRGNSYMRTPTNLRNETSASTAQTNQPLTSISKVHFSKRDYRKNEDSEVQTFISESKVGHATTRTRSARSDLHASEGDTRESCLDSSRSETSRTSRSWRGKGPHSARSEHAKEAEGQEVTRLLKQLCAAGDTLGNKTERQSSAKNAQLVCVNASSPRQPTTPQLLRILEETIQKKIPNIQYMKPKTRDAEKLRLAFNIPQRIADNLFQYRTKFVQHMLTSSMYANSAVGKPWEMISSVSESIIDEVLVKCAAEMQIQATLLELYQSETQ